MAIIKASTISLDKKVQPFANSYLKLMENSSTETAMGNALVYDFRNNPNAVEIPAEFLPCLSTAPASIHDLKDGIVLDAFDFQNGDELKLGLLGFANVNIEKRQKVTVVEYAQIGSQVCNGKQLKYGIGARMMMHITSSKRSAKLNTPQQITASVIFDRADVRYSLRTFGISGPGTAKLIKAGTLTENTYTDFIKTIAELVKGAYSENSSFVIHPQPMFLR